MSNKAKNTHLKNGDSQTKQAYTNQASPLFLVKSKSPPHREHRKQKKHRKENNPLKKSALRQPQTFY